VEYATAEQAQQAINTLSNQNLMGRLVYVREVCNRDTDGGPREPRQPQEELRALTSYSPPKRTVKPNRASREPRRLAEVMTAGWAEGGMAEDTEHPRPPPEEVASSSSTTSVFSLSLSLVSCSGRFRLLTLERQLPYNVGWQDLKDLFRQAGM
jgi:RNA recognition motif-containing protein